MQKEFVEAIEKLVGEEYGDNLNESEQKDAAKKLKDVKAKLDWGNQLELTNVRLMENNQELGEKALELNDLVKTVDTKNGELSVALMSANSTLEEKEKVLKEYIAQAGTCDPELTKCRDNLRIASEKASEGISAYSIPGLIGEIIRRLINSK